jgi:hypothetical protein
MTGSDVILSITAAFHEIEMTGRTLTFSMCRLREREATRGTQISMGVISGNTLVLLEMCEWRGPVYLPEPLLS